MQNNIISNLKKELAEHSSEAGKKTGQRFFKENIQLYGINNVLVTKLSKKYAKEIAHLSKNQVFELCEELWQSGFLEETIIACHWSLAEKKNFEPSDFKTFEKWIDKYVKNWASCDTFCNHTVGEFLQMYPEFLAKTIRWTKSKNRWLKRASAVSLIVPARRGKFLEHILTIADLLLLDADDMVQKGYGWMLKVASQTHQQTVFDFLIKRKSQMPRTALRYAIEKMPQKLRKKAMER